MYLHVEEIATQLSSNIIFVCCECVGIFLYGNKMTAKYAVTMFCFREPLCNTDNTKYSCDYSLIMKGSIYESMQRQIYNQDFSTKAK